MILTDTHTLAWLASGDRRLPAEARDELLSSGFFVSAVTAWEYADLHRRGRFPRGASLDRLLDEFASEVLDYPAHAWSHAASLPLIHRDPIDRMLISHALVLGARIATADANIRRYDVERLW